MIVLGIETSCDDTAAAVVEDGKRVLSNILSSQIDIHKRYGGVVPELASRAHIESILPVIEESLNSAEITLDDIDGIAVTKGPGLVGSLLVGISVAKAIAYTKKKPLIGINHLEGHILSANIEWDMEFPFIALIVSGGHTNLYIVRDIGDYCLLGKTRDDAAGEVFDKIAKFLNIGFPGGPIIEKMAKYGNPRTIEFPRTYLEKDTFEFSFSGLKTSVLNYIKTNSPVKEKEIPHILASFQEAVVDVLISKSIKAADKNNIKYIVLSGGVSANTRLREKISISSAKLNIKVIAPSPELCRDNAVMIAVAGYYHLKNGNISDLTLNAVSNLDI